MTDQAIRDMIVEKLIVREWHSTPLMRACFGADYRARKRGVQMLLELEREGCVTKTLAGRYTLRNGLRPSKVPRLPL